MAVLKKDQACVVSMVHGGVLWVKVVRQNPAGGSYCVEVTQAGNGYDVGERLNLKRYELIPVVPETEL